MASLQGTVYVIDDDDSVRKAFERLLRSANIKVETFSGVDEFLDEKRHGDNACVIVDLRMPGATGFDLQRELTSQGIRMPVIVISASDDAQTREQARRLGATAFFRKPIDDQALLDAVWWAISGTKPENEQYSKGYGE
ncbi:MAG: response regulator [Deltaproteobacteria bacterium]|nr:response regulator [Deltaproteobacteria bacterium]